MDTRGVGGRVVYFEDGELIFEESSTNDELYIIENGQVELSQRIAGKKTTIAVLGKGDFFGETLMFRDTPRSVTATAKGRAILMSFSLEELLQNLQSNLQFAINLLQALMNRLRSNTSTLAKLISRIHEFSDVSIKDLFPEKQTLKIGEILVEMGCLTKSQLERSLQKQKEAHMLDRRHKLLGEMMVEAGIITEDQLRSALIEQQIRLRNQPNPDIPPSQ